MHSYCGAVAPAVEPEPDVRRFRIELQAFLLGVVIPIAAGIATGALLAQCRR